MKAGRFQAAGNSRFLPCSLGASAEMPALAPKAFRMGFLGTRLYSNGISRSDEVPYSADQARAIPVHKRYWRLAPAPHGVYHQSARLRVVSQDVCNQAGEAQGSTLNCRRKVGLRWITLARPGALDRV
jgi:hypothetical protein